MLAIPLAFFRDFNSPGGEVDGTAFLAVHDPIPESWGPTCHFGIFVS